MKENNIETEIVETAIEETKETEAKVLSEVSQTERVSELVELRSENTKVFQLSDGCEEAVYYSTAVHVLDDEADEYVEIDTAVASEATNSGIMLLSEVGTENNGLTLYSWQDGVMTNASDPRIGLASGKVNRLYMRLSFPSLPANARIKKAELKFTQKSVSNVNVDSRFGLYEVGGSISLGECTPVHNALLTDYEMIKTDTDDTVEYTFDITEYLDRWIRGETGVVPAFVLKLIDEATYANSIVLYGTANSASLIPCISVVYESGYSMNGAYQTHDHSLGRFGRASIDLACGNLMFESEDFALGGTRMPVTIRHLYNSAISTLQYTQNTALKLATSDFSAMSIGKGWKLNVMQSMMETNFYYEGTAYNGYVYIDENGEETYFKKSDTRICNQDQSACYYLYDCVEDDSSYYDPEQRKLWYEGEARYFDESGKLIGIKDKYNNSMSLVYTDGRLKSILDGVGRIFSFDYDTNNNLTSIGAPNGKQITYTYDSSAFLTGICYPDGRTVEIAYTYSRPSSVILKDADGNAIYKVVYTFYRNRMTSVVEYGVENGAYVLGTRTDYSYSAVSHRTIVQSTEPADTESGETEASVVKTVYVFDKDGNVVSEYAYTEETGNIGSNSNSSGINPHSEGMSVSSNIDNLLLNHAFRGLDYWTVNPANHTDFNYQCAIGSSDAHLGSSILLMESNNDTCVENEIYQTTGELPAGVYTFSVYAMVVSEFSSAINSSGAYIRVTDLSGNILAESERITHQDDNYIRLVAPFEIQSSQSVRVQLLVDGCGGVFICGAQLENNPFANAYNILENSNFERDLDGWEISPNSNATVLTEQHFNMSKSLAIPGSLVASNKVCQTVYPKRDVFVRETFTLSGWAKGTSLVDRKREGADDALFRLRAEINYLDNTSESFTADFTPCTEEWQMASVQFAKSKFAVVDNIKIYCEYCNNIGTAYFDNIQLIRDSIDAHYAASEYVTESEDTNEEETVVSTTNHTAPEFEELIDSYGNTITETTFTDGEFGSIYRSFGYNAHGNDIICETDARGFETTYTVDALNSRNDEITDRCGNKTAYEYDSEGRTTKVISKNASGEALANVSYTYDAFDNLTEITRDDGMKYALAYNSFHNLESIGIDGKTEPLVNYSYKNGNGRLKSVTYANGDTMKATYNSIGQMVAEKWYNSSNTLVADYRYVYDGHGNIVQSLDICCAKMYNYLYDDGRIARATESDVVLNTNGFVTSKSIVTTIFYYYNSEDTLTKKRIVYPDGTEQIVFTETNDDATVVKFQAGGNNVTSHGKNDTFGRKVFDELQLSTGFVSRQFSYLVGEPTDEHKENGKLKSTATTQLVNCITFSDGRTISYEYDAEERITKVTDSVDGVTEYTYDALGQLLTETVNDVVVNAMTYDNYGNILTKNGKAYTYGDTVWKDKLTSFDGQSITYDAQGNPVTYLGHNLTWEKGRQLKSFDSITYTYNANGIRTSKTVNGVKHTYTLDGTKILREAWGNNTLIPLYDFEDSVCGIIYNGIPFYFLKNLQGDIIAIVDKDANLIAKYTYDAWGKVTSVVNANGFDLSTVQPHIAHINPFRYRGYYYDEEIGLYYLQSRYYDPITGRFVNADEVICTTINDSILQHCLFMYCINASVNYFDPLGYLKVKTWLISTSLDVLFSLLNHAMMIGYISLSGTIWVLARTPFTRKAALKLVKTKVIPVFVRGFYNSALTCLRKVLQSFGKIGKEFAKGWTADKAMSVLNKYLSTRFMDLLTSMMTWGGIISLTVDILDGKWDGYITL